jgi:hypothetical protein
VLVQALASGHIGSLAQGRNLVLRSTYLTTYEPANTAPWDEGYRRFSRLLSPMGEAS